MLIGFDGPTRGPLASPANMLRMAREGEALGFDTMTVSDHVVVPANIESTYPYTLNGEFPSGSRGDWFEQLTSIAWLAGQTSKLRFLTSVMVVPHRPAVLAARMLATLDVLSGGRLTVACGAGWLAEEFEALGLPPFAERGRVTDEYIEAFRELWTADRPRFEGRYVRFSDIVFSPKPVQSPLPVWIGGESPAALRRAARLGDAWYPIGSNPQFPLDTLDRYREAVARVRQFAADAGRDPASIKFAYRSAAHGPEVQPASIGGQRRLFAGAAGDIASDIRAMREMGVVEIDFRFYAASLDETLAAMRRFRDDVLSKV